MGFKPRPKRSLLERHTEKWRENDAGCWLWTSIIDRDGYGRITVDDHLRLAHRVSYELWIGTIPDGLTLDHLCRMRMCVNPAHLEPVSMGENTLRGVGPAAINARKTHCIHGHPLSGENLLVSKGERVCRTCKRIRGRDLDARGGKM